MLYMSKPIQNNNYLHVKNILFIKTNSKLYFTCQKLSKS